MEIARPDDLSTHAPLMSGTGSSTAKSGQYEATPQMTTEQVSFAHEKAIPSGYNSTYEAIYTSIGNVVGTLGAIPFCCCIPNLGYKTVPQGNVGLISRFGKFYKAVDPGLHYVTPIVEDMKIVEIKIQVEDIPRQTVTTKDNVSILIDSVLYWHIVDPFVAAFLVADVRLALMERTQTTLRHVLGTRVLQDAIENRDQIAMEISELIAGPASSWGVKVESMLVKDMHFSEELQQTLSAAAKQKRIGESKVIQARAEVDAAKLMRQAADVLSTPAAMQIRYLDTLSSMARTANSKVIFMPGNSEPHAVAGGPNTLSAPLQQTIATEMASM